MGGTALEIEVDTDAELFLPVCTTNGWQRAHIPLHLSSVVLLLHDGSVLPTKRIITTQVKQDSQTVMGSFIIVENVDNQLPLLGHNWLYLLQLDWPKSFQVCTITATSEFIQYMLLSGSASFQR